jgi:Tfp pilus assembly protein PilF
VVFPFSAYSQVISNHPRTNLEIEVRFDDETPVGAGYRVELEASTGPTMAGQTNVGGQVFFPGMLVGEYLVRVRGNGVDESGPHEKISVGAGAVPISEVVRVRRTNVRPSNGMAPVSAAELRVPQNARAEVLKAISALQKNRVQEAHDRLTRALRIYPDYAEAHNALGVIYFKNGERERSQREFENAIRVDSKHAAANLNLGRILLDERRFVEAEQYTSNAAASDPTNAESWLLLAMAQLFQNKFDDAIKNANRVHQLPHDRFAVCHYVASVAYEKRGEYNLAATELKTYLAENPAVKSPVLADHVRELETRSR